MSEVHPATLRRKRDDTIARLCEHFARDDIDADELERLIDLAHEARSLAALEALTGNLPVVGDSPGDGGRQEPTPALSRKRQSVVAIMSGADRKGAWVASRRILCFTLMGGATLDFRESVLPEGTTEVEIYMVMGGVEVVVPPGVRVECEGFGLMGAFQHPPEPGLPSPEASRPVLRITGVAFMGGVGIEERFAGESVGDARRRRKKARRRIDSGGEKS